MPSRSCDAHKFEKLTSPALDGERFGDDRESAAVGIRRKQDERLISNLCRPKKWRPFLEQAAGREEYGRRPRQIRAGFMPSRTAGASHHSKGRISRARPEVTNGLFLSHKRTERERRSARVAEFRRKRPSACARRSRETGVSRQARPPFTDRRKLATDCFRWTSCFARSAYVRLCVKSERSVTSGRRCSIHPKRARCSTASIPRRS
jgi:hypothetical protein